METSKKNKSKIRSTKMHFQTMNAMNKTVALPVWPEQAPLLIKYRLISVPATEALFEKPAFQHPQIDFHYRL